MFVEGQKVIYAGDTDPFNEVGAPGKVLSVSGDAAHVQWLGGPKTGSIELVEANDLVGDRNQATALLASIQPYLGEAHVFEASLDVEPGSNGIVSSASMQVRSSYDEHGEDGALSVLDESGVMAVLATHAEEVISLLGGKVATDAHMREALSGLEIDEQDVVVAKVVATLLTDRLKES